MLLFELAGELFQLLAREPELLPLFQLPLPRSSLRGLHPVDPSAEHPADFGQLDSRDLMLVLGDELALLPGCKPQIETQSREAGICGVEA